ncbi:MAG: hypothetical protein P8K27_09005 [Gammaproteobacteria bacterium]|nr:hypothetical protein [Gammaproteobacteria bacterium]
MRFEIKDLTGWQRAFVIVGYALMITAASLFSAALLGALEFQSFSYFGQSGIRSLAGVGVTGCLFAAIGFWDR